MKSACNDAKRAVKGGATAAPLAEAKADTRERRIAELAYSLALARGFGQGHELEDWLKAEREIDAEIGDEAHRR